MSAGARIPTPGFGTWFIDDGKAARAIRDAVATDYRNIGTTDAYGNELAEWSSL